MIPKNRNIVGQTFGRIFIVKYVDKDKWGRFCCECLCSCGAVFVTRESSILRGYTKSCGCLKVEHGTYLGKTYGKLNALAIGEASKNALYSAYKRRSKNGNILFSLTKKEFISLCDGNCFYCGKEPSQIYKDIRSNGSYRYNGIDKINPLGGYTQENSVSCCWNCNRAKGTLTQDEFIVWIKTVYDTLTREGVLYG